MEGNSGEDDPRPPEGVASPTDPTHASPARIDELGREHRRDGVVSAAKADATQSVRRRELVLRLVATGAPRSVVEQTLREREGVSEAVARGVFLAVAEELREEYEDARPYYKAQQVERLQRDLAQMRAVKPDQKTGKSRVNYRNVLAHETLLARVLGTLEPVKQEVSVDATVKESLVAVVAGLSRERMDDLVAEQLALEESVTTTGRLLP